MSLSDLLTTPDLILPKMRARRPDDALRELAECLARHHPDVSQEAALRVLREREELGSTALGGRLAVPHAKLDCLERTIACLGRARRGIDFGAPDGETTQFFLALVAPPVATGQHLTALARISRLFRDPGFRDRLLAAESAAEMYRIVTAQDAVR